MPNAKDLVGQRFEHLTVISRVENDKNGKTQFRCLCDCGTSVSTRGQSLHRGQQKSCGCHRRENARNMGLANTKHGESWKANKTVEYEAWKGMIQRCHNKKCKHYPGWGGRGITVCPQWRESFESFLKGVGRRPSPNHSLDRIDNEDGYRPGNVRWTTWDVQANNRRKPKVPSSG